MSSPATTTTTTPTQAHKKASTASKGIPIWVDCGSSLSYSTALALLDAGHHPELHLLGVSLTTSATNTHAANWLKVSGLQHIPIYAPNSAAAAVPVASSSAPATSSASTSSSSASVTSTSSDSILIGPRFPPITSTALHHESLEKSLREITAKHGALIWIQLGSEKNPVLEMVGKEENVIVRVVSETEVAQQQDEKLSLQAIRDETTPLNTPYSALLLDLLASPEFSLLSLSTSLTAIHSALPAIPSRETNPTYKFISIRDSITSANSKSHINKKHTSKAPSQKPLKPGQVAGSSSSSSSGSSDQPHYPAPGPLPPSKPLADLPAGSPFIQLQADLTRHVSVMLVDSLMYDPSKNEHLFILYDDDTELSRLLARAYRGFITEQKLTPAQATFFNFHDEGSDAILSRLWALKPGDSVILVQSQHFQLNDYRIRLELFKRSLRSIEHVNLCIIKETEYVPYVAALAFSSKDYGALAYTLKSIVDSAQTIIVTSKDGSVCKYTGGMQACKLNIGDYRNMPTIGGTYPIGEVFSEAKNLSGVNGELSIFGYPSLQKQLVLVEQPMKLRIKEGTIQFDSDASPPVLPENCTPEFRELLGKIREGEGEIAIREFGMGLNKGMSKASGRTVSDIFAFERQHGLHVSLGKKHNVYKADTGNIPKRTTFHIDIFVDVKTIEVDGVMIYQQDEWTVGELKVTWKGEPLVKEEEKKAASVL